MIDVLASLVLGIVCVDLVFDFGDAIDARMYYAAQLASPLSTRVLPVVMGAMVGLLLRKYLRRGKNAWTVFLVAMFGAAAPFFETVLKPAEARFATSEDPTAPDPLADLATIGRGHAVLAVLCVVAIAVVRTEPTQPSDLPEPIKVD